jgi:hypothetical protein
MISAPLSVSWSWATSTSDGETPARANAAAAASMVGLVRPRGASHGENTSNDPNRRLRSATEASVTGASQRSAARSPRARTSATAPSFGLQNMYCVSGGFTGAAARISASVNGFRRQA